MLILGGSQGSKELNTLVMESFEEIKETYSQDVPSGYGLGHGPLIQDVVDRLNAHILKPPISASDGAGTLPQTVVTATLSAPKSQGTM